MIDHVQQLFSGERVVQSPLIRNDALVQQARAFLDGSNATDRLYQRAKAAMLKEAPDEFTVLRAVGPQAGTVFTRASDAPLSRGVPGLFARNERVVCVFESAHGPFVLALVGATIVGSMATVWHGVVNPPRGGKVREWRYADQLAAARR